MSNNKTLDIKIDAYRILNKGAGVDVILMIFNMII